MNKATIIFIALTMLSTSRLAFAQTKTEKFVKLDISMYPKVKKGYKQLIIQLPVEENENDLKIELFIGLEKLVDCNYHTVIGKAKEITVEGWGYDYYMVESSGETMSTRMGCPTPPTRKFVSMSAIFTRYNSKLPIVLYVPKDFEVQYRFWKADTTIQKSKTNNSN